MNIRNSMYRMVFSLIVIPFLFFSILISFIYTGKVEAVITDSLHVVANAQVAEMTSFCEQQKEALMLIGTMNVSRAAMRGELDQPTKQYLDNMLYSRVQVMNYMESIAIIDTDNRIVASSNENENAFADEGIGSLITDLGNRGFYISNILVDKQEKNTLVEISKIEDNGELLGYVVAEIDMDFYNSIRENAELWNDATFYLLDGQMKIISAGTPKEGRNAFVTTNSEREDYNKKYSSIDFERNPQGCFRYKVSGRDYITYYSNVKDTDWQVMLSVDMESYQATRTVIYVIGLFIILLCAAVAVLIGRFASKRIVRPIACISGTLQEIRQKQDYTLRVEAGRQDELGELTGEVNKLLDFIETENLYKVQQQRLLQKKAGQDALTKVMNKERISQYLQEAIVRHGKDRTSMAVLFVDVDDFKAFNTNYGHSVGDEVLLFLTSLLEREFEGTVGRVGGDEFLVVVEKADYVKNLDMYLNRFEEAAAGRFIVRGSGAGLPVTCCVGAVRVDFSTNDIPKPASAELVNMADQAMYHVKNNGKKGHIIYEYNPLNA